MCSECGEGQEPICGYCGDSCYSACDNPDACRTCWFETSIRWGSRVDDSDHDAEFLFDKCLDEGCVCICHEEMWEDLCCRFEGGLLKFLEEDGPPYERRGDFPFLKLPGEIREKIYSFSFLQDGKQRKAASHRGTIHTALLGTCRQIYNEARHLPLTINKLCFDSAVSAHDFLGFLLAPTQKDLVTSIHIEFHMMDLSNSTWQFLMRELNKMPITHLGLTVKGGVPKQQMLGHTCFTNRFKGLKGLKTFDLILASAFIKPKDKEQIQEEMRETLIKDYKRSKQLKKSKPKRAASADLVPNSGKTIKKAKKASSPIKHQTKIVASPKSNRLGFKSHKAERDAAKATKSLLLDQYNRLKQYATSLDSNTAPVKIRLERAREAAEAVEETKFEKLAHGILSTLEEQYNKITAARRDLPVFHTQLPSPEPLSSQELIPSLDSPNMSQQLM